ncbi:MAG: hydroxylamine reductase [Candidatus Bipolaricaulis sp.]|nr:hydroxylamine reductase [Candidatus Bipolaricaulis sp.]
MFCYQCEQTKDGKGCTAFGVCGKDPTTAVLQDHLLHVTKGISMFARRARALGARDPKIDRFVIEALFSTVTNVNFDPERLLGLIREAVRMRDAARDLYSDAARTHGRKPEPLGGPATWTPASSVDALMAQESESSFAVRRAEVGDDAAGLQALLLFGLKGAAAYADHALLLGKEDEGIWAYVHEALDFLAANPTDVQALTDACLRCGAVNYRVMQLLDEANTSTYGMPSPTPVRVTPVAGKAILVSGHDLKDLYRLLQQTEGKGVNVYTHGEMLPAHGYPKLRAFRHLVGNYGGAWQDQQKEFDAFPGAVLMTTNCIQKPRDGYKGRIFTTGLVAWPGVRHVADGDFSAVIQAALDAQGFAADAAPKTITVGFGRKAVLDAAGAVVDAVRAGKIRHFFLIGGCDGAKPGRNYYTDFAKAVPQDCLILTLACGKYRFNKLDFGTVAGLPRLLDVGQCNDAYSAIEIAKALAGAFNTDVNSLPLSLILSWYEQKAVVILLTLLSLGIRNIRIGPSLPAFVTPAVLGVLVKTFGLTPISTPERDLEAILG